MVPAERGYKWRKNAKNVIKFRMRNSGSYVNLDGATVDMVVKTGKASTDQVLLTLSSSGGSPAIVLSDDTTTPLGYDNWVTVTVLPAALSSATWKSGVYDIRITYSGQTGAPDVVLEGTITLTAGVTT